MLDAPGYIARKNEMVVFITRSIYIIWGKVHLIHIMQPFQMILRTVVSFSDRSVVFNIGTFRNFRQIFMIGKHSL